MTIKSILVHLDHEDCSTRIDLALRIATAHDARLIGLFAENTSTSTIGVVPVWSSEDYRAAAKASRESFTAATAAWPNTTWRETSRGGDAAIVRIVTSYALTVDLTIFGKDQGGSTHDAVPAGLAEQVILRSGGPCLVTPNVGRAASIGRRPVIAWNGTRQASAALRAALPLMAGSQQATLLTVGDDVDPNIVDSCLRRLADHDIVARHDNLPENGMGVMDLILARAGDVGADMLVMGGHEHGAIPFLNRKSGTRYILAETPIPLLMCG